MARHRESFQEYLQILCCPRCKSPLKLSQGTLECQNSRCSRLYPIVNGKPILINDDSSLFSIADYLDAPESPPVGRETEVIPFLRKLKQSFLPLSSNLSARRVIRKFVEYVHERSVSPTVLVVGAGDQGEGMEEILTDRSITRIDTDVSMTSNASIICDAHDLPFIGESIDGVIVQAVLEHVVDPQRCVAEIYRVLSDSGIVYSEIPFMQQVHLGRLDFSRFTHLGHRRLFRHFEEIESGMVAGPGTSLAWCCSYLLRSFGKSHLSGRLIANLSQLTFFWFRYLDYVLRDSPGALDAASCTYFFGRKSREPIPDKDLVAQYRGAQ